MKLAPAKESALPFNPEDIWNENNNSGAAVSRRAGRLSCGLPGQMAMLLPELSFRPRVFGVRVVDISPLGARLQIEGVNREVHDLLAREKRWLQLILPTPRHSVLRITARQVWLVTEAELPVMGIEFATREKRVSEFFEEDETHPEPGIDRALAPPVLNPFPGSTAKNMFPFTGTAPHGTQVAVRVGNRVLMGPVVEGGFRIEVDLAPDQVNMLTFWTVAEGGRSVPVPVAMSHESGAADTVGLSRISLVEHLDLSEDEHTVSVRISGRPSRFFRVLKILSRCLSMSETATIEFEATGDGREMHRLLSVLDKKA